jgi:ribosomal protein S27AE
LAEYLTQQSREPSVTQDWSIETFPLLPGRIPRLYDFICTVTAVECSTKLTILDRERKINSWKLTKDVPFLLNFPIGFMPFCNTHIKLKPSTEIKSTWINISDHKLRDALYKTDMVDVENEFCLKCGVIKRTHREWFYSGKNIKRAK